MMKRIFIIGAAILLILSANAYGFEAVDNQPEIEPDGIREFAVDFSELKDMLKPDFSFLNDESKLLEAAGAPNSLTVGETGRVVLGRNPTTGFTWHYAVENDDIVKQDYENDVRDSDRIGSGNTYTWNFKALKEGQTRITFKYYRDWEGEASTTADNTVEYPICVNPLSLPAIEVTENNKLTPEGGLSPVKAKELIAGYLAKNGTKGDIPSSMQLSEITVKEVWENTGVQLYRVDVDYAWLYGVASIKDGRVLCVLYGMPTNSVFLADLDNDGHYEIYTNVSYGSGFASMEIRGYNIASDTKYSLSMRMKRDLYLFVQDQALQVKEYLPMSLPMKEGSEPVSAGRLVLKDSNGKKELAIEPSGSLYGNAPFYGSKVAYAAEDGLYCTNMDDGKAALLVKGTGISTPVFSGDGKAIAFTRNGALYAYDFAASEARLLLEDVDSYCPGRDGGFYASSQKAGIEAVNPQTAASLIIVSAEEDTSYIHLKLSPDSGKLLIWLSSWSASLAADGVGVAVYDIADGKLVELKTGALAYDENVSFADSNAFVMITGGGREMFKGKSISQFDLGSGQPAKTHETSGMVPTTPCYSTDGKSLAFAALPAVKAGDDYKNQIAAISERQIYMYTGGKLLSLTKGNIYRSEAPEFLKDNNYIVFARVKADGEKSIWLTDNAGNYLKLLAGWKYSDPEDNRATDFYGRIDWSMMFDVFDDTKNDPVLQSGSNGNSSDPKSKADSSPFEPGTVYALDRSGEMVVSYDAGNSFSLGEEGRVVLSYANGEATAEAPLILNTGDNYDPGMKKNQTGFYISREKTAIAFGGDDAPIQVLTSDDMGKTWNTYTVEGSEYMRARKFIGFITADDGWLVASPGSALGTANNYVFLTSDGGKTWTEIGNPNGLYARNVTGAGFSTQDIGFIGYRVDDAPGPTIYWTQDRGKTWEKLEVTLPEEFDYNIPLSPVFFGANGLFPIQFDMRNGSVTTIYLTSKDYGKTWTYDSSPESATLIKSIDNDNLSNLMK